MKQEGDGQIEHRGKGEHDEHAERSAALWALVLCVVVATVLNAEADDGATGFSTRTSASLDFPVGRCGGHAQTGVRWTAPVADKVTVSGSVWKLRNNDAATVSLWLKGSKVVDRRMVPPQGLACNSQSPLAFSHMVTEAGAGADSLQRVDIQPGDEIVVQVEGNDYVGIDLTVSGSASRWDLATDFSDGANPNGPWTYGQVTEDGAGKPGFAHYASRVDNFGATDFLPGQTAWCGDRQPWYFSFMKSSDKAPVDHEVRFWSEKTVYVESLLGDTYVGRYWSSDSRINIPYERYQTDAFGIEIDKTSISGGWQWMSCTEAPAAGQDARHIVVELTNTIQPIRLRLHTLLDGTPIMTRWLEVVNTGGKPLALTAVYPWSAMLISATNFWGNADPPKRFDHPFTLGRFAMVDHCWEGWFRWEQLPLGQTVVGCDRGQCYDDPFFVLRNEGTGQHVIGSLAWPANWRMELERTNAGSNALRFRAGPWATDALRVVSPGEAVATPAVHMGMVHGGLDAAVQGMHDHVRRSVLPKRKPERSYLVQYSVPGDQGYLTERFGNSSNYTEKSVRAQIDLAAEIEAELFIMDAGWWAQQGDWDPSPDRFPNGLTPLVDYAHKKGMLFGLYAEIEKASPGSKVAREHPEWIEWHKPYPVLDLARPDAGAHMEAVICGIIDRVKPDLFRLDFNTPTSERFEGVSARVDGIAENRFWRYYDAFYGVFERVHRKYPDLILQQAACGGGRNDLGVVARFHEQYLTDGLRLPYVAQDFAGQTLSIPPEVFAIAIGADGGGGTGHAEHLDTYLRVTYATSTPWVFFGMVAPSVAELTQSRKERFLHYSRLYKQFIRPMLPTCKVYHHEPVNMRGGVESSGWFAMEFAAPDRTTGWGLLIRIGPTDADTYVFKPRGIDRGQTYRVTFDSTGETATVSGLVLARDGLPVRFETMAASELVLFARP